MDKKIVEINGVKVEIDLREATQVESFRVGDKVKLLKKQYNDWKVHYGTIVDFADFKNLPTIVVAYLDSTYNASISFSYINGSNKDEEIVPVNNDMIMLDKEDMVAKLDKEISTKLAEIDDLKRKKEYFIKRFAKWFKVGTDDN